MLRPLLNVGVIGVAGLVLGCTGSIGDGAGFGTNPNDPGSGRQPPGSVAPPPNAPPPGALPNDAETVPGAAPLRRLTRLEYENTVRDLLG